ncbi:MAG: ABC transporter permease [Clostridiales bacterium]|nr:ABC transporter permease [Clostridiales bacterium]
MILGFYRAEMLKLRHTKILWAALFPAILCNLYSLLMLMPKMSMNGEAAPFNLQEVFYRQGNLITISSPFIFALVTAYILTREYRDRTINQLFTYPVSRIRIFAAKLGVVFTITAVASLLSCVSAVLLGCAKALAGDIPFDQVTQGIGMNLSVCVLSFGTIPLAAAFSIVSKNVIPPMVLGAFASFVTLILELGHTMKAVLFPWATPYYLVRTFGAGFAETGENPYIGTAVIILLVTFLASLAFCLWHYDKAEVHSGS